VIARGPAPTVSIEEALASRAKRLERDVEMAAWCGLDHNELGPFLDRLAIFDARTPAWQARRALAELVEAEELRRRVADSRPAMLGRVDAVIAELVEQLAEAGYFGRREVAR
jgi:hypothetical protein